MTFRVLFVVQRRLGYGIPVKKHITATNVIAISQGMVDWYMTQSLSITKEVALLVGMALLTLTISRQMGLGMADGSLESWPMN